MRPRDSQEIVDRASQVVPVVKNLPASAGDLRDGVRSPGQEDPLKEEMATHSGIFAWEIPWTERSLTGSSYEVTKSQTQLSQ